MSHSISPDPIGDSTDGFLVVDLSDNISGQFAARLFADIGHRVVLVETPSGSTIRTTGPFSRGPQATGSLLFGHLNSAKHSVIVDPSIPEQLDGLDDLLNRADLIILDEGPFRNHVLALKGAPTVVDIVDFHDGGPYSAWRGSEIVYQALSGHMAITGAAGREPLFGVGERTQYATGAYAFIGGAALLHDRISRRSRPRRLQLSRHECAAAMEQNFSTQWSYSQTLTMRGNIVRPKLEIQCSDGWVSAFIFPHEWSLFCHAFDAPHLASDPRFSEAGQLERNWSSAVRELRTHALEVSAKAVAEEALRLKIVLTRFKSLSELRLDPHLIERDYWYETGGHIALGPLFRPSRMVMRRSGSTPSLGSCDMASFSAPGSTVGLPQNWNRDPVRPLEGIRILELTSAWAGPMTGRILANLGADVVKVEGPSKLDAWRFSPTGPFDLDFYPSSSPGDDPYNRSAWFNSQNHDKRSLGVDIKVPDGLSIVKQLALSADVLVANWSPGALDRAGLGYETLSALNSGLILVEMPAAGNTGPMRDTRGLGPTMEAASGIGGLIGYPDGMITGSGAAYNDPMGALHGAIAVVSSLLFRDVSGEGQYVEVAQQEAAMHWIGELILDSIENDVSYCPSGNRVDDAEPHDAFPTVGDDAWIAIGIFSDAEWDALRSVFGPSPLDHPNFATVLGRKHHASQIRRLLSALTSIFEKGDLAARLQAAGVIAGPVQDGCDLHDDPHLRVHSWFASLDHPSVGRADYPGLPFVIDGERLQPTRVSPCFGIDNADVIKRDLGVSSERFEQWTSLGVLANKPARG